MKFVEVPGTPFGLRVTQTCDPLVRVMYATLQTRLDRHEQVIRGVLWALSVIGGAFLTTLVAVSVLAVKAWMKLG